MEYQDLIIFQRRGWRSELGNRAGGAGPGRGRPAVLEGRIGEFGTLARRS